MTHQKFWQKNGKDKAARGSVRSRQDAANAVFNFGVVLRAPKERGPEKLSPLRVERDDPQG
jgi:hypothetical protein